MDTSVMSPEQVRLAEADADYAAALENYMRISRLHKAESKASSAWLHEACERWQQAKRAIEAGERRPPSP